MFVLLQATTTARLDLFVQNGKPARPDEAAIQDCIHWLSAGLVKLARNKEAIQVLAKATAPNNITNRAFIRLSLMEAKLRHCLATSSVCCGWSPCRNTGHWSIVSICRA